MRAKVLFASPAGALLAFVSFFLPWAKVSCAPVINKTVSGANLGGALWLVPPLAAGTIVSFFCLVLVPRRWFGRFRLFAVVASATAVAIIVAKCLSLSREAQSGMSGIASNVVGLHVKPGGAGTLLGLVLWLAGALIGRARSRSESPD